jgi:hypothetical protein
MLRTLAVLLLLANLLFFAWARGWLAPVVPPPHQGEREPERLAKQVRPEAIQLFTPQAASAAAAASATCLEAGPFGDADVGVAEAALLASGVPASAWARQERQLPTVWLVYMGRFADTAALNTKQDELRRLKLGFEELQSPPELAPGLAISRHETREAAETALAQATERGVRSARVVALSPPRQLWLRAARADAGLQARLRSLKPPVIAAAFGPCANRP